MPTEFKPGKIDQTSSDSIVDTQSNKYLPVLRNSFKTKLITSSPVNHAETYTHSKTYDESKKIEKITVLEFISNILLSDILWLSISIACLLATVLFYFQILQPLVLQKYTETAEAQVLESNQKFYLQAEQLNSLQQQIVSHTENLAAQSCTEEAKYDQSDKDRKDINNFAATLKVDSKIKQLPNFGIFYDNEIKKNYLPFITEYQNSLNEFQPIIANIKHLIEFVDYKNSWIDQCIRIQNSTGNTKELQAVCTDINIRSSTYNKIAPGGIIDGLTIPTENIRSLCAEISTSKSPIYPQYNKFKSNWLSEYDTIRSLSLVTDSTSIENIKDKFRDTSNRTKIQLENVVQNRQDFHSIWYILNFRIG
ncbi:MAG: hypothetical protein H7196_02475 [candidate division SR1 bacterium]|nr:hypothetical protein [candidate division SR1 bacterium]